MYYYADNYELEYKDSKKFNTPKFNTLRYKKKLKWRKSKTKRFFLKNLNKKKIIKEKKKKLILKNLIFFIIKCKFRNFFLTATNVFGDVFMEKSCGNLNLYTKRREKTSRDTAIILGRAFATDLKKKGVLDGNFFFKSSFRNNRVNALLYGFESLGFRIIRCGINLVDAHNGLRLKKQKRK